VSQPESDGGFIELAAVVRSHGLRGELLLKPFNPASELWDKLQTIELKMPSGIRSTRRVLSAREHSGSVLLTLEGVRDRDGADALRGSLICVPRSALPPLADDEYYLADLVGLIARDPEGRVVGKVRDILEYPAACCLIVESAEGLREVPDLLRYVPEVHVAAGYVVVDNLDELDLQKPEGAR
jgi:16S rRNA processing protein RimM